MGFYSDYLVECLKGPLREELFGEVSEEDREWDRRIEELVRILVDGKIQWLAPKDQGKQRELLVLEGHPDKFAIYIDLILTRHLLAQIDEMSSRLRETPSILLKKTPPGEWRTYLMEATRCYLYGLFQACAILSRAALHAALLARLEARGQRIVPATKEEFAHVIRLASEVGILKPEDIPKANQVRESGGNAAHGQTVSQGQAKASLVKVRQLMERLYA